MAAPIRISNRGPDGDIGLFRNDVSNLSELQSSRLQKRMMEEAAEKLKSQIESSEEVKRVALQEKIDALQDKIKEKDEDVEKLKSHIEDEARRVQERIRQKDEAAEKFKNHTEEEARKVQEMIKQKEEAAEKLKDHIKEEARKEREALMKQLHQLEESNKSKDNMVTTYQNNVEGMKAEKDRFKQIVGLMEQSIPNSLVQGPNGELDNCLPLQYHKAWVKIVNVRSLLALDAGKDGGNKAYAYEHHSWNRWQVFQLCKFGDDPSPRTGWRITNRETSKSLCYPNFDGSGVEVHTMFFHPLLASSSAITQLQSWAIGRESNDHVGSWVIQNHSRKGTYIGMDSNSRNNGGQVTSRSFSNSDDTRWVIIPVNVEGL